MSDSPHSEFILDDERDGWWNEGFLELMARRLELHRVERALDVGCGHGHWGQLWARRFAEGATLLGFDREPEWVERASARARALGLDDRFGYRVGDALDLPVEDGAYDLVTCQTVLMHLAEPERALSEMLRALAPGGLVLLAEPCNAASLLVFDSPKRAASIADTLALVRFHLTVNQGRLALGEGDHSFGARLPELVAATGLEEVRVHLNDNANPVFACRERSPAQRRMLAATVANIEARVWLWERREAERLYRAGGGDLEIFELDYEAFMADARAFVAAVRDGSYSCVGGSQHYLVSARKPSA